MTDDPRRALTEEEIEVVLRRLPGWTVEHGQLAREFRFKNFIDANRAQWTS